MLRACSVLASLALLSSWVGTSLARPAPSDRRFLVVVRGIEEGPDAKSGLVDELRQLFVDELKRHPQLSVDVPADMPRDAATDPAAWKSGVHAHGFAKSLEVTLRVLAITSSLQPPPTGKPFRVLKRGVSLAVFGSTLPEKVMAIGGDGDAALAVEIRKNEDEEKAGRGLVLDAAKIAIKQAVDMTVTKLELPPPTEQKKRRKK